MELQGDRDAAREAWGEAAMAWERAGRSRTAAALAGEARTDELEAAIDSLQQELAAWRRTALAWRQTARSWNAAGDDSAASAASARAGQALARIAELEGRLDEYSEQLATRRGTLLGAEVSDELQDELVDRWAEVARSWELTALTWQRTGETGKARIARMKAEEARDRIREVRPQLDAEWFRTRTYPPGEAPPPAAGAPLLAEITAGVNPLAAVDGAGLTPDLSSERQPSPSPAAGEGEAAPADGPDPGSASPGLTIGEARLPGITPSSEDAVTLSGALAAASEDGEGRSALPVMAVPEIPPRPAMPPDWLLTRQEKESIRSAGVWRQSAETWRKTALGQVAAADWDAATTAINRQREAAGKALALEEGVRVAYARREAEISNSVAKALGEPVRTETDVLTVLDAQSVAAPAPSVTGDAIALAPPPIPGQDTTPRERRGFFDLEIGGPLPSTLSIRGRKVVDVNYGVTSYLNPSEARTGGNTQSSFGLNQELQVEVLGRVGSEAMDHINVNIRYDDTQRGVNSVNNRSIGVDFVGVPHKTNWGTYQYDADFGDISVSLPGSEFAFYNKSLFGATANLSVTDLNVGFLQADRINLVLIGSQTKGVSASKEFSLAGERVIEDIRDISFALNKYFLIEPSAANLPLQNVVVYKDDQNGANDLGTVPFTAQGSGPTAGFAHAGNWNQLVPGIDYTLNQTSGELELIFGVAPNDVLAVSYAGAVANFGSPGIPPRLIRVSTDTSAAAREAFRVHEVRNRYVLNRRRIKKDDPDLVFEIRDQLGFTQTNRIGGVPTTYLRLFGFDRDANNKVDVELIDYDFGVIRPVDTAPFQRTGNADVDNAALYTKTDLTDADGKYTIHIEYASDQPQEIFTLGFDILKGSDIVYVDGVKATRDVDYFIDYEAGIITFLNKALIRPESKIRVDYEYLPFGGQIERTLMGTRLDVQVNPTLRFGSTLLYDFAAAVNEIPNILEDKPTENVVAEVDVQLSVHPLLFKLLGDRTEGLAANIKNNFRLDFGGEWAWAQQSPNTFGSAMIEDFEAIENIVGVSMARFSWQPSSPPPGLGALTGATQATRGDVGISLKDNYGPRTEAQVDRDEKQTSLQLDVNFAAGETWVAIRQPLSTAAINFQDITTMELYTSQLPASMRVFVDIGVISEDVDGLGAMNTEDLGLDGVANTGDIGENNGVLNSGEDRGISFTHPGRGALSYGANDGVMTTEDMNANFRLDQNEAFFRIGELNTSTAIERKTFTGLASSAWRLYRAPWRTGLASTGADSAVIKHIRLVFVRDPGQDTTAQFFLGQLNFRGNRFVGASADSRVALLPRNNENDPNYSSPPRTEVKAAPGTTKEQSLGLRWTLGAGESVTVQQRLPKQVDLADYQRLTFFLAGDARGETFSLMLVSDDQNYIEIRRRVATGSDIGGLLGAAQAPLWERIDVPLEPIRNATIANILGSGDTVIQIGTTGYEVFIVGRPSELRSPSLSNINQIWLRIHSGTADSGEIWIDDIYAAEPVELSGLAQKANFTTGWGDIWSLSGSWRDVPGKFRGVGFINNPQGGTYDEISQTSRSLSATLQIHRLLPSWIPLVLPVSANWSENTTRVDPDRVENTLKTNLGQTTTASQNYSTTIQLWRLPSLSVNYSKNSSATEYRLEDRTDQNSNLNANTSYAFTFPKRLFGIIPTGDFLGVNAGYMFSESRNKNQYSALSGLISNASRTSNQAANFQFTSRPISLLSLSFDHALAYLDRKSQFEGENWRGITSRNNRANAALTIPSRWGISPGISFSGNFGENFSRATFGGRTKDIQLGGDFRLNVGLDPSAWGRIFSWLTARYSYGLSSNASYRALNTGTGITDVAGDYVAERLFPWGSSKRVGQGTGEVTANRSSGSTNITHNLSGEVRTFSWLSTSYSASFSRNEVASLSTLSLTDGLQGTLNMRFDYMQAFPNSFIKFRSSYLTAAVSYGQSENAAGKTNSVAPTLNWNAQWTDALNTTFSMSYNRASTLSFLNSQNKSVSEALTPSMNFTYYFDLPVPEGVSLPGVGRVASFNRRVQLSGGVNASFRTSEQAQRRTAEQANYGMNLSLGYRIASNLEVTASTSGNIQQDKLEKLNDLFTLGAGARVEWRF